MSSSHGNKCMSICSDLENEEYDIKINILVHEFLAVRKQK